MQTKRSLTGLLFVFLLACEAELLPRRPEIEKLPEATQEGLNTFGCLVNGKAFSTTSAEATVWKGNYFKLTTDPFRVKGPGSSNRYNFVFEILDDPFSRTAYLLNDSSLRAAIAEYAGCHFLTPCNKPLEEQYYGKGYVRLTAEETDCEYFSDEIAGTGNLYITHLDTINHIVSGKFDFYLDTPDCWKMDVSEGRFDISYEVDAVL